MAGGVALSLLILALEICCSKCGGEMGGSNIAKVEEMNHNSVATMHIGNGHAKESVRSIAVLSANDQSKYSS